jgi:transcriptional regulator of arginine metabolism
MIKADRHRAILELVRQRPLSTQGELRDALRRRGIRVDQATVSRDLRELGVVRVPDPSNGFRYGAVEELAPAVRPGGRAVLARFVRSIEAAGNLLVIKTESGTAATVGEALDRLGLKDIIGTVAGDNTIFAAVREGVRASYVLKRIRGELARR